MFDWIPFRFRPVMRLGVRICLDRLADGSFEGMPDLNDDQREGLDRVRRQHFSTVLGEAQDRFSTNPQAMAALSASVGDDSRPFLDWLFKDGGWRVLYSIAQMILLAFGIILPPLPPAPVPPTP